jgi:hypothetical protein
VLLLTVAWVTPQVPSAAARATPHCGAFRGKRLLRIPSVTVMVRTQEESREYAFICVPPGGRIHLAGWAFDETVNAQYSVKVLRSAGSWVAIQFASTIDYHGGEVVDKMCNARNGRCYYFFNAGTYAPDFEDAIAQQPVLAALVINRFGQMLKAETLMGTTHVVGIGSDGTSELLDSAPQVSIPPTSLKLVGHEASWSNGAIVKRAKV